MDISKKSINERFVLGVNFVLKNNKTHTKTLIAQNLTISPTKFSEILNDRMNVGTDTIALFCKLYGFNGNWILTGEGEMFWAFNKEQNGFAGFEISNDSVNYELDTDLNEKCKVLTIENKYLKVKLSDLEKINEEKQELINNFLSGKISVNNTTD